MLKDKLTAAEYSALEATNQPLYVETKGENGAESTFTLHPAFVAERTALTTNNSALKTEKQKAADRLKLYEDLGLTPEQIAEFKTKAEQAEAAKLTDEQKKQRAEEALKKAHKDELDAAKTAAQQREDFLTRELRRNMIEAQAKIAIEKAGVIEGGSEVLLPHLISSMEMVEDGEGDERRMITRVVGPDKQPRYIGSDFMTVEHLVEDFKKKPGFGGVFKAAGTGGGGAQQQAKTAGAAQGSTMKRAAFDALSPTARAEHVNGGGTVVD